MKKLPKVYQNKITKKINNNKTVCYLKEEKELFNKEEYVGIANTVQFFKDKKLDLGKVEFAISTMKFFPSPIVISVKLPFSSTQYQS